MDAKGTTYVTFRLENGSWLQCHANVEARSATEAIRKTVEKLGTANQSGTYTAVPRRSWQPMKVAVETQTRLVVGTKGAPEDAPKDAA